LLINEQLRPVFTFLIQSLPASANTYEYTAFHRSRKK